MGSQTFTASGSWVCPPGVTLVTVSAWGGGGNGSIGPVAAGATGGQGGGGGAYASSVLAVTPGNSYSVVVGAAATDSSFAGDAASVIADGAVHNPNVGGSSPGGFVANSTGTVRFAGGSGAAQGTGGSAGGGGGAAGHTGNGNNGSVTAGGNPGSGSPTGGKGGNGGTASVAGQAGTIPGGGGGGAGGSTNSNGAGARGEVRLSWADPITETKIYQYRRRRLS